MKVAVITGVSGGIGKEIARKYIENGYFVVGQYNSNQKSIGDFISELKNNGQSDYFFAVKCDFNVLSQVEDFAQSLKKDFKHIDVLISCAGIDLYKLYTETTLNEWNKLFNVNLNSAFVLSRSVCEQMVQAKSGKIIFISSIWGAVGGSMESAYSASKSALIGLTKSLAKELAPSNVNVNCICPGVIDTPMNDCFNQNEKKELIERTPLKRFGKAEEVANLSYFLTSEQADFITGQIITIDGGFTL